MYCRKAIYFSSTKFYPPLHQRVDIGTPWTLRFMADCINNVVRWDPQQLVSVPLTIYPNKETHANCMITEPTLVQDLVILQKTQRLPIPYSPNNILSIPFQQCIRPRQRFVMFFLWSMMGKQDYPHWYFFLTKLAQMSFGQVHIFHPVFIRRAWLAFLAVLNPNPPQSVGRQILSYLSQWTFLQRDLGRKEVCMT